VVVVVDSEEVAGDAAGATVSVFCSHAASNAAPVRMQSKRFIDRMVSSKLNRSKNAFRLCDLQRSFVFEAVRPGDRLAGQLALTGIDSANQRRLLFTRFFQSAVGEKLDIAVSHVRQRLGRSARLSRRHVRDAIVSHVFLDICRLKVRRWPRCLRAAPLID